MPADSRIENQIAETLAREMEKLQSLDLERKCVAIDSPSLPHITVGGKTYLHLASSNYLGLATHSDVIDAGSGRR